MSSTSETKKINNKNLIIEGSWKKSKIKYYFDNKNNICSDLKKLTIPYILNGNIFEILKIDNLSGAVTVRCTKCPDNHIYKGSVKSTGNFHMHIKRKHPDLIPTVNDMKLKSFSDRKYRLPRRRSNLYTGTSKRSKSIKCEKSESDKTLIFETSSNSRDLPPEPIDYRHQIQEKFEPFQSQQYQVPILDYSAVSNHLDQLPIIAKKIHPCVTTEYIQPPPAHRSNIIFKANATASVPVYIDRQYYKYSNIVQEQQQPKAPVEKNLPSCSKEVSRNSPAKQIIFQNSLNKKEVKHLSLSQEQQQRPMTSYENQITSVHYLQQPVPTSCDQQNLSATNPFLSQQPQSYTIPDFIGLIQTPMQNALARVESHLKGIEHEMNLRNQIETNRIYLDLAKFKFLNPSFAFNA